ncbi:uncharacterized protein LOC143916777 [Arctopsyche grandis]|uniref:uncharacterized protein LOC143916777 n=1 Tax=Arctopsyche grandis TaxID=121162 RepID=UPI00406D94CF
MSNLTFETTQKNGALLIVDEEYCYTRHRAASDISTEYWVCEQRSTCPGRGITKRNRREFHGSQEHNHLPNRLRLELRQVKIGIRKKASSAIGANTTTPIVQSLLKDTSVVVMARLPKIDSLKRTIQRHRNKTHVPPPLPRTRNEIIIPAQYQTTGNTNQPEQFLQWDSGSATNGEDRILMFTTQTNLDFLRSCQGVLMDGTFKTTPHLFTQLYTIHGTRLEGPDRKPGKAIPLVFLVLPNKNEETYVRAFHKLKTLLPGWEPDRVMMDFERAAINGFQTHWPRAQVTGCYFHLCQSIYRKIKELGLSRFYGQDTENAMQFKMVSALALVPPENVIDSWVELRDQIMRPWKMRQREEIRQKIDKFLDYFEDNYIGAVDGGVRSPPHVAAIDLWNVRARILEHYGRTDNEVEGFHMKVAKTVEMHFPNLWQFFRALQGLQAETKKLVSELNSGIIGRKQLLKYIQLAERIHNVTAEWPNRQNLETYLRGISNNSI